MAVHSNGSNEIGKWNPAWGPRPQIRRAPSPRQPKVKNRLHSIVCPNGCIGDEVRAWGPDDAVYSCATCGIEMIATRVICPPQPRPTSVNPGERYGRLVVMALDRNRHSLRAVCLCDCGMTKIVLAKSLRAGQTKSCGCLYRERDTHPWRQSYKTRGTGS